MKPTPTQIEAAFDAYLEGVYLTEDQAKASVIRIVTGALSAPVVGEPVAVKPSIDTMREAALELVKKNGWEATARLSLHQVTGLMAQFGMNVSRGEVGCGYPECGCCADAACSDAIQQHPDFKEQEQ